MAPDGAAPLVPPHDHASTRPLPASLRWGLGWTVLVASLGVVAAGCTTGASVDAPGEFGGTSSVTTTIESTPDDGASDDAPCVIDLGGTPDAIERHIAACEGAGRLQHRAR